MSQNSFIKCLECGIKNQNTDYCSNCGAIINIVLKRRLESEKKIQKKIEEQQTKEPDKIDLFFQKALEHPNPAIRSLMNAVHSVWTFGAMIVGALIAMVIGVAAG